MATSLEDFSYFFWPLIILGAWCLFEGDTIFLSQVVILLNVVCHLILLEIAMICNKKSWPLPYRWAEVPWIMEVRVV